MELPNGCSSSELTIFPTNWNTKKANVNEIWRIDFYFKDPNFRNKYPYGKPIRLKEGINRVKNLSEKQQFIKMMRDDMIEQLIDGYNPITKIGLIKENTTTSDTPLNEVLPSSPFIKALRFSLTKSQGVKGTIDDTRSVLNKLENAAIVLDFLNISISQIHTKHIKLCLDACMKDPKFSVKRFNKAKSYLSGLYKYLIEIGAAPTNMAIAVTPMKVPYTERILFTDEEIALIKDHLYTYNRPFYKFMMMFYYSGGRIIELMRLKGYNVDLKNQTYTTIVKKGGERPVTRTIRNNALEFWTEQMKNCKSDDFVFSKDLLPGIKAIHPKQVEKRWTRHVMKPLGIKVTFYKFKHLNADRTIAAIGALMAAGQMGHTSTKMAEEVYAYNEKKRIHEGLKNVDIDL